MSQDEENEGLVNNTLEVKSRFGMEQLARVLSS